MEPEVSGSSKSGIAIVVAAGSGMAAESPPHDTAASIASINTKATMTLGLRLLSIM